MGRQVSDSSKNVGSKTGVFIFAGFVVLAAVIGIAAYFYISTINEPVDETTIKETADGRGVVLTKDNMEEVFSGETVDPGYFETCMTNEWTFVGGKSSVEDVYVKNAETNTNTVYFDLFIDDQKLVYSSPYIPVGVELPQFELTESLSTGDYQGTVTYHLVDDNNKELSDVSVAVTLHVK